MAEQFEQYNVVVIDSSLFPCKLNDEMMNCLKSAKSIYVSGTFHAEMHELEELLSEEDRKNCDSNMKQLNTIIHPKVMNLSAYPELNSDIWDFLELCSTRPNADKMLIVTANRLLLQRVVCNHFPMDIYNLNTNHYLSHKLYPTIERHYTVDNNDKPVGAKAAVRFGKGTRLYAERRNGKRSEPVVLGDMLGDGQGGEGNVYHLTGEFAGEVAKIYKNGQFPTNKFIATREMVQNRRFEEIIWTVFPVGILYADKDFTQPVGIMERYTVTHSSLYDDELFFGDTDNWTRSLLSVRVSDLLYLCKCVTRQICYLNMLGVTVADYNIKNFDYPFSQRDNRYRRSRLDYIQMWDSDSFGYNNYFSGYMADVNRKNYDINKKTDILDLCNDELYSFLFQILTLGDNPYNPVTGRFNYENDSYYQYARKNLVPPSLWRAFESFFTGRSKASPQMMLYLLHEELNRRLRTGETDVTYRELVSRIDAGFFDKAAESVPPVYSPALNFFPQGNRVTPEVNGGDNSHPAETGGTSGQTGTTVTVTGKSEIADSDKNSDLPDKPKRKLGCLTTSLIAVSCLDCPIRLEDEPTWPCLCGVENLLVDTFCGECSRDFLDLYKNIDFKGDRAGFFRYIRRNPNAKQALMSAIADGSVPFTPAMRPQPAQPQPTDDHTVAYAAPEQTAPLQPTGSLAPEQTMPPRRVETKSAKKTNTVMLAVVVAAVVVCAALMTMLLMALLRNGQEEAQKPEPAVTATAKPPTPTKRHEKKPTENGENGEAGTSVELPTESEKSTESEQPTESSVPDNSSAGESVNPEENPLPESLEEILLGAEGGCHDYNSYNPYDSYDFYNDRNAYGQ